MTSSAKDGVENVLKVTKDPPRMVLEGKCLLDSNHGLLWRGTKQQLGFNWDDDDDEDADVDAETTPLKTRAYDAPLLRAIMVKVRSFRGFFRASFIIVLIKILRQTLK